ncbi:MAG: hypothetical protein CMB08_07075 [Euryarchaeota archaeon]|nr:hypothetical protein [Euryarchaeota archaeon]|tara:strand:- start:30 stop:398 length:369 start_codon:yes stop_codon:yes gene_type:complete
MLDALLDYKNVALANIGWALLHVWIAIEIEESMGFLAVVVVIGCIFVAAWRSEERLGRRIMLLPSILYLLVLPAVAESLMGEAESSGYEWLDIVGPIIWFVIIPITILASTQEWTGIGVSEE